MSWLPYVLASTLFTTAEEESVVRMDIRATTLQAPTEEDVLWTDDVDTMGKVSHHGPVGTIPDKDPDF